MFCSKKKLLVIDDDPAVLFAIRRLLFNRNIDIDTSESFDEAVKFIDNNVYHIIITDLGFSDQVDNAGIVISYYARQRIPNVIIVLWTARDISELSDSIQHADIDLCLSKPVAPNAIYNIIESMSAKS